MNYKKMALRGSIATACCGLAFGLMACGDDVTNMNSAVAILDGNATLSEQACSDDNAGELLYVPDSLETFFCNGSSWVSLKGADGKNGAKGKDGSNGTSCVAKMVTPKDGVNGIEVTCAGKSIGTIWDGNNGKDGDDGKDGKSCSAEPNADGTGIVVSCGGVEVGTILNGQKGADGKNCSVEETKEGSVITCEGSSPVTVKNGKDGTNGKNCSVKATDNGSVISCEGSDPVTIKNGTNGKSCSVSPADGGYKIACEGSDPVTIKNGTNGENCEIKSDDNGKVTVSCANGEEVIYKAACGANSYDPTVNFCYDREVYPLCQTDNGLVSYNPEEEACYVKSKKVGPKAYCLVPNEDDPSVTDAVLVDRDVEYCDDVAQKVRKLTEFTKKCGSQSYDPSRYYCVDDKLIEVPVCKTIHGEAKDSITILYDADAGFCDENGTIKHFTDDAAQYQCGTKKVTSGGKTADATLFYDPMRFSCDTTVVYDGKETNKWKKAVKLVAKADWQMKACGKYDASSQFCNPKTSKAEDLQDCDVNWILDDKGDTVEVVGSSSTKYDPLKFTCHQNDELFTLGENEKCASGEVYNSRTHRCEVKLVKCIDGSDGEAILAGEQYCKDGKTPTNFGTMADGHNNVYNTIEYGNYIWMAENMGKKSPEDKIGSLYTWAEANDNLCPASQGWRIPTAADWDAISASDVGEAMKSLSGWTDPATGGVGNGKDLYGFDILPNAYEIYGATSGMMAAFWQDDDMQDEQNAGYTYFTYDSKTRSSSKTTQNSKLSVRCVKDNKAN